MWYVRWLYAVNGKPQQKCSQSYPTRDEAFRDANAFWRVHHLACAGTGITVWGFEVTRCDEQYEPNESLLDALLSECDRRDGKLASMSGVN